MALKRWLKKEDHKKLPADIQKEYKAVDGNDAGDFELDLDGGFEDTAALKRAKDHEKREANEAKRLMQEAKEQLATAQQELQDLLKGNVPKADLERLEKSYKDKFAKEKGELETRISELQNNLTKTLVDNVASTMAAEISTSPLVILPHITKRLKAEFKDGKAETKVLDRDGNISALTTEDLKKELLTDKQFAPILIASKGSGGGANGNRGGGADHTKKPDFAKASVKEIADYNASQGVGTPGFVRPGSRVAAE